MYPWYKANSVLSMFWPFFAMGIVGLIDKWTERANSSYKFDSTDKVITTETNQHNSSLDDYWKQMDDYWKDVDDYWRKTDIYMNNKKKGKKA